MSSSPSSSYICTCGLSIQPMAQALHLTHIPEVMLVRQTPRPPPLGHLNSRRGSTSNCAHTFSCFSSLDHGHSLTAS
ncbi:hypothetical protein FIBSPDRAFT_873240 [Athelia psychrophila]|uniref:Uncharacterized protein n=1 Tax=Athelia psychrophila TaxID=1759441 RepID=A0A165YPM1_9AGAM|nr:hypothetical protein FIBSPDRAFT_873240 [Fibularhizoctonia sp. CBS 109695]